MQAYREKRESIQYTAEEIQKMAEAAALRHLGSGAAARVESLDSGYQVTLIQADGEEVLSYPLNAAGWPEGDGRIWGHDQRYCRRQEDRGQSVENLITMGLFIQEVPSWPRKPESSKPSCRLPICCATIIRITA
jgi:hypothetical protein